MLVCVFARPLLSSRGIAFIAAIPLSVAAVLLLPRQRGPATRRGGILLLSLAAGLLLGAWSIHRMARETRAASLPIPREHVSWFSGVLTQDSTLLASGDTLVSLALAEAGSTKRAVAGRARGLVLVFLRGSYAFSMGQVVRFDARLASAVGPGKESFTASADRADTRRIGFSSGFWAARAEARDWVHRAVSRAGYPVSALMEALLIGAREDVPEDLTEGFRRTGSLHILALSGLHVSVIYGILIAALGFLRSNAIRLLVATSVLLAYQILAGFMPSLLRATIMICLAGACILLDRDREPLNLLCLSGIVILLVDPFQAGSLSFQLSFLALAGILLLGPLVQRGLEGRIPGFILAPLAMSVAAQVATFPLVIARFGTYYPSGLVAGLILVPLTTVLLWAGLAWILLVLIPWPLLHDLGARALGLLYEAIDQSARTMGWFPGITFTDSAVGPALALSVAGMLLLAFLLPRSRRAPDAARS